VTRLPTSTHRDTPFGADITELHPGLAGSATMNRLVVISNRVPLPSAGPRAGGLAVALDGLMEKRGGLWFGWSGVISPAAADHGVQVAHHGTVDYATVDLTPEEHDRYYNGFSNGVLWPLLHSMPDLIQYDRTDAQIYREVNTRLASQVQGLIRPDDLIWVHDYHLLPLPAALRAAGVANPIGFFLHIPFAAPDVLESAPDMGDLVSSMLASDLVGFQTEGDMANFAAAAVLMAGAVRQPGNALLVGGRRVLLGVFPVEIEAHEFAEMAEANARKLPVVRLRQSLPGQTLILGLDRLDPTKGLLQRISGLRRLLEKEPALKRRVTLLQVAAISRKEVGSYRALKTALDRESGNLNADFGEPDWLPLRMISHGVDRATAAGFMRAARIGLVTPLRDGMNLVAKEFVAAQDPADPGVLILSRFAGAAQQLDAALLVNPHDADAMADAMVTALNMKLAERQARWQSLWAAIEHRTPLAWGRTFLATLLRGAVRGGNRLELVEGGAERQVAMANAG
jgi:trehalose 6-phosphate synthase